MEGTAKMGLARLIMGEFILPFLKSLSCFPNFSVAIFLVCHAPRIFLSSYRVIWHNRRFDHVHSIFFPFTFVRKCSFIIISRTIIITTNVSNHLLTESLIPVKRQREDEPLLGERDDANSPEASCKIANFIIISSHVSE